MADVIFCNMIAVRLGFIVSLLLAPCAFAAPQTHAPALSDDLWQLLTTALASSNVEQRIQVSQILGDLGSREPTDPRVLDSLRKLLLDHEPTVRIAAVDALRRSPSARATQLLLTVFRDSSEQPEVRLQAAGALLLRSNH